MSQIPAMTPATPLADRELPSSARATRSPFIRLNELIAGVTPAKSAINLTVGEPQHPIPPFVGEVIQRSLKDRCVVAPSSALKIRIQARAGLRGNDNP